MCDWVSGESESPDRIDTLVWTITELMGKEPHVQAAMTWDGVGVVGRFQNINNMKALIKT